MKQRLFFIAIVFCSCSNDIVVPLVPLDGKFVEQEFRLDTLIFDQTLMSQNKTLFIFRRPKEIQNGFLLPKIGSGIYEYKINESKISLYNTLSSCYCFNDYTFLRSGEKIFIENFYDPTHKGEHVTFVKIP